MASKDSQKFKYTVQFAKDYGFFSRPLITVKLAKQSGGIAIPVLALIDSGSPVTLIHNKLGKILDFDIEQGETGLFGGVAGESVVGHKHSLSLEIAGITKQVQTDAWFSDLTGADVILGSVGFFDNFKVVFEQYADKFEVCNK